MQDALRLYLDTADLIAIADGEVTREVVDGLHEAMRQAGCALVFSVNHAWDFYPRSDEPTRARMLAAFEQFPVILFAEHEPQTFEGAQDDPRDLILRRINIRELVTGSSAMEALGLLDHVTSKVQEAEQQSLLAARATRDTPLKKTRHWASSGQACTSSARCTLHAARKRNLDRNSKRSDLVDLHHVQYLPYVDIVTTDKENVAALTPLLSNATLRRSVKLLRNRNLARVAEEVFRLGGVR